MKWFDKLRLYLYIRLHRFLNNEISRLAVKVNDNIHPKHRITNYHQFFLDNIEENSSVLDIGCGLGIVAYKIAKKAKKVVAIDINKKTIQFAKQNYNRSNIVYINADATKHKFDDSFDIIILSNVLEHLKDRINFLKRIKKLGNLILIRVPMINRDWLPLYEKELGLEYRLDLTHYIEYTLESFKKEMDDAGLKISFYSIQFGEIWAKIR